MLRIESLSITLGGFSVRTCRLRYRTGNISSFSVPPVREKPFFWRRLPASIHRIPAGYFLATGRSPQQNRVAEYRDGIPGLHALSASHGRGQYRVWVAPEKNSRDEQHLIVKDMCALLEIGHLTGRYPGTLSGGEHSGSLLPGHWS